MKTKEELTVLKEEVKAVKEKLSALTEEELEQVVGGSTDLLPSEEIKKNGITVKDWIVQEYEITL